MKNTKNIIISVLLILTLALSVWYTFSYGDFYTGKDIPAMICFLCTAVSLFCCAFVPLPIISVILCVIVIITTMALSLRYTGALMPVIALAFFRPTYTEKAYIKYKIPAIALVAFSIIMYFVSLFYNLAKHNTIIFALKHPFDYVAAGIMLAVLTVCILLFLKSFDIQKNTTKKKKHTTENTTGIYNFFFLCSVSAFLCLIYQFTFCNQEYAKISVFAWCILFITIAIKDIDILKRIFPNR